MTRAILLAIAACLCTLMLVPQSAEAARRKKPGITVEQCGITTAGQFASSMIDAIRNKDIAWLQRTAESFNFDVNKRLVGPVQILLYDDSVAFGNGTPRESLYGMIQRNEMIASITATAKDQAVIYYIKKQHEEDAKTREFYKNRWQIDYHACKIRCLDDQWQLVGSICYAESDGPFGANVNR